MISLAKVTKPWGLLGAVSVFVFSRSLGFFCGYRSFFIEGTRVDVLSSRVVSKRVVVSLSCSTSLDCAERLRDVLLCLPREEILLYHRNFSDSQDVPLDKNQADCSNEDNSSVSEDFLVNDFIGFRLYGDYQNQKNFFFGEIITFYEAGNDGVFEVLHGEELFFIPANLSYFSDIDLQSKRARFVDFSQLLLPENL